MRFRWRVADLKYLPPIDKAWQPTDFLPDLSSEDFVERLNEFGASAQNLTGEILIVLVGDMITEETLSSYALQRNQIAKGLLKQAPTAFSWIHSRVA